MKPNIQLYNTLTRSRELYDPHNSNEVRLYVCGPTVYDYAHIGNMRTYIFDDILRRTLEYAGYQVKEAMNITDVGHLVGDGDEGEDKLEVGAQREGRHPLEIAKKYEEAFFADLTKLNIKPPTAVKRATDAIPEQIALIRLLGAKGFTYTTESAIYFDTTKLADYGKLTGQSLEEKQVGAREEVVVASDKKHPTDFVLWFFLTGRYKNHILHWSSPWGEGFPGWHIECSAISRELLGQPFDIHTGGVDHIGTHHTNEIAQSEAAFGEPLARFWLHSEFLLVEGSRMGKSEGNLLCLADLEDKGFSPLDFRYLCLTAHYRSRLNFTWEGLKAAQKTLASIRELVNESRGEDVDSDSKHVIEEALFTDLDTPKALALLHEAKSGALWQHFDLILGLDLQEKIAKIIPEDVKNLAQKRLEARNANNWGEADSLRQEISNLGYEVRDISDGFEVVEK